MWGIGGCFPTKPRLTHPMPNRAQVVSPAWGVVNLLSINMSIWQASAHLPRLGILRDVLQKLPKALLQEATDAVDPTRRASPAADPDVCLERRVGDCVSGMVSRIPPAGISRSPSVL